MKMTNTKQLLSFFLCIVLIAAMALITTGCTENPQPTGGTVGKPKVVGDGATVFQFVAVDLEGNQSLFEVHTDEETVGAALLALGCHLCRTCQSGNCSWGIATQRPELVKRLDPDVGHRRLVNLMTAWRNEIMELMGGMGINSIEALRGNRLMLRGVGMTSEELEILGIAHAGR